MGEKRGSMVLSLTDPVDTKGMVHNAGMTMGETCDEGKFLVKGTIGGIPVALTGMGEEVVTSTLAGKLVSLNTTCRVIKILLVNGSKHQ
jgi:hypothetical protein